LAFFGEDEMNAKTALSGLVLLLLIGLGVLSQAPAAGYTRVELTQADTGKTILSIVLRDGEAEKNETHISTTATLLFPSTNG
jgi:hypothetical protein